MQLLFVTLINKACPVYLMSERLTSVGFPAQRCNHRRDISDNRSSDKVSTRYLDF
jgi:hypothetical protein